jgi:hypothetical protein
MVPLHDVRRTLCTAPFVLWSLAGCLVAPAHAGGLDVTQTQGSDISHVDLSDGAIMGEFLGRGVECAQLRLHTGEQISIEGQDFSAVTPGTVLRLTGDFVRMSRCMQGRAFVVSTMETESPAP